VYLSLFIILGIIASFLIHAAIEIPIINLLVKDFDKYGLGFTWQQWYRIHHVGSVILLLLGIVVGYLQGKHWWKVIYITKSS
ncbi:hypothetical protein IIA95_02540, partial [Patescibacteria group bacterium]|nr:hypothetical protein [Patescibacteria group bacterium]